ncbi:MAG TPA: BamA/TamA family outer membrane protein, partial [Verrucomicrobiae bacterium]|nr:BamA/TamA family outer membrane protein [Verrucomicrobiae bacterium]
LSMARVSSPQWSPDGKSIAYAVASNGGENSLRLYEVAAAAERTLLAGREHLSSPAWEKGGGLVYVSDRGGVYNLFRLSSTGASSRITNLIGGAFHPSVSPDGRTILYSAYGSRGFRIASLEAAAPPLPPILPSIANEAAPAPVPPAGAASPVPAEAAKPYSSLSTLPPTFWLPMVFGEGDGVAPGAFTAGMDALGYHSYMAAAAYGPKHERVYYDLRYTNDWFYPTFSFEAFSVPFTYADFFDDGDFTELNRGFRMEAAIPLNRLESRLQLRLGWETEAQRPLSELPGDVFVFQGRRDAVFAGIDYSGALRYPLSISPEEGRNVSLLWKLRSRHLGGDLDGVEYLAEWTEYIPLPFRRHVLAARVAAGFSFGDRTPQQTFQVGGQPSLFNRFSVRGFPSRFERGRNAAVAGLEYRAPVWNIFKGRNAAPFFFEKLHVAAFADAGEAWGGGGLGVDRGVMVGVGGEVRLDLTLGYHLKITPAIGVARGLGSDGEQQAYLAIYSAF